MKYLFTTLALLLFIQLYTFSQQQVNAKPGDIVRLNAGSFRGTIQWEQSTDETTWSNVENGSTSPFDIVVNQFPIFFRGRISEQNCEPTYSEITQVVQHKDVWLWSDPETWGGSKPGDNAHVVVPHGKHVILDETPPTLSSITIDGTLEFMDFDVQVTAKWIMVEGKLQIGSPENPFQHKAIITLTGIDENIHGMGTRGIMVMGGILELHGATPDVLQTKINQHAMAGTNSLTFDEPSGWETGDEIVIGPTDYYTASNSSTQKLTITNVSGTTITTQQNLIGNRWGLLQYATTNGISLSNTNLATPPLADTESEKTPLVLDERAPVGNLTRNIVIESPNDPKWINEGFGVHIMIMGSGAAAHVEGVEIKRAGQRGKQARYPFHWHMLSYEGSQTLSDAEGQYIRRSSIYHSSNRGIVIHGTNGLEIKDNVLFDIQGHGIFTEDAVERRNTIDGNLVLKVRNPPLPPHLALKQHEIGERGSSGFWISNPDNIVINNTAADCHANGFWLAFPAQPWGLSSSVLHSDGMLLNPSRLMFGVFDNNTAHSNGIEGIQIDRVEIDNAGNTGELPYSSTTNGRPSTWNSNTRLRFTLSNYKVWKNNFHGIWDRAVWATNTGVVSADNCNRFFAGSGADGLIERCLVVGTSLNHLFNGIGRPASMDSFGGTEIPAAFATYHSTFDIKNNIVMHFPVTPNKRSGVYGTEDYYERPVEKGHHRNISNYFIDAHPGVKVNSIASYYSLASALWDPYGLWGPEGNYFVYDTPFLTYGLQQHIVEPQGGSGGVSVPGPFYGFNAFVLHGIGDTPPQNRPYNDLMGIHVTRLDESLNIVGTWQVNPAQQSWFLNHMRHFATHPSGIYELTFPQEAAHPTLFQMDVENMLTESDTQLISVQFDGNINARVRIHNHPYWQVYEELNSFEEVRDSNGAAYWQDKPNNKVWIKIRGGFWQYFPIEEAPTPTSDQLLYETVQIHIYPK